VHELSLSSAILETAERHAAGRRVTAVAMTIGALRQVVPESLSFYWEIVSRDTVCDGAALEQTYVPGRLACRACGHAWELQLIDFRCPRCLEGDAEVKAGDEFEVESITVEEEAPTHA
jgi:hydrogenase nickel incorporation protein HypA/HybF